MRSAAKRGSVHAPLPGCCGHAERPMIDAGKLLSKMAPSPLAFPYLTLPPRLPLSSFAALLSPLSLPGEP